MKLIVFSLFLFFLCHVSYGKNYNDQELLIIGQTAFAERAKFVDFNEQVTSFRNSFNGLNDAQKIRSIVLTYLEFDKDPRWSMTASLTDIPVFALGKDPTLITDYSELREILRAEKDPRHFYLYSTLIPWSKGDKKYDFIAEHSHMLFGSGRVAKEEGEYTRSFSHDVTAYAYQKIVNNLKILEADFEPPNDNIPHKERILILAQWLKENWKGCENLQIPGYSGKSARLQDSNGRKEPSREKYLGASEEAPNALVSKKLVYSGALLIGLLFWWYFKNSRKTS